MKRVSVLRRAISVLITLIALNISLTATCLAQTSPVRSLQQKALSDVPSPPACLTNPTPGPGSIQCYSPQQLWNAYGIKPLLESGITGKGRKIVVVAPQPSSTLQTDLHLYDQLFGLNDPELNIFTPFGTPPDGFLQRNELEIGVEMAHSMAPDATINVVLPRDTTQHSGEAFYYDLLDAVKYAIDQNLGDAIAISFTGSTGESCFDSAYYQYQHELLQEARDKHISVFAGTGDTGAAVIACPVNVRDFWSKGTSGLDDPLMSMVGATTLQASVGQGTYQSETPWNDPDGGATGGGFSSHFPRPAYQLGVNGNDQRGEPDVSLIGKGTPFILRDGNKNIFIGVYGGASASGTAWAGLAALFDQYAGRQLGFLNAGLYRIAQSKVDYGKAFHDITTGNNTFTDTRPPVVGYDAGVGWDPVTGLGTPNVAELAQLLPQYVHDNDGGEL